MVINKNDNSQKKVVAVYNEILLDDFENVGYKYAAVSLGTAIGCVYGGCSVIRGNDESLVVDYSYTNLGEDLESCICKMNMYTAKYIVDLALTSYNETCGVCGMGEDFVSRFGYIKFDKVSENYLRSCGLSENKSYSKIKK